MKLMAVAVDYDGTLTVDEVPDPQARAALYELRGKGFASILVTGRMLRDLRRVAGNLGFADVVVAENGAVIAFPNSGRSVLLGRAPSQSFLDRLRQRGMDIAVGECIVETDARNAVGCVEVIRAMELPLVPLFNRGRLMILPQGISKATGLHAALRLLRLSEHNAIAIGDAENDHTLLQACEVGAAVEWGSPALQRVADDIVRGDGPPAVAAYIRRAARDGCIPPDVRGRRRLLLGQTSEGEQVGLAVRGRMVLIAGDSRSGKSSLAGLLCEQLILQRYSLCIIDAEGDYRSLARLPGVVILGADRALPDVQDVAIALGRPDTSVVVDLSGVDIDLKRRFVATLLADLATLRERTGLPHRVVLDEAQHFLSGSPVRVIGRAALDGHILITYRFAELHPEVRAAANAILVTRLTDPEDLRVLYRLCGAPGAYAEWVSTLGSVKTGQIALLPGTTEAAGGIRVVTLEPRLTAHVRHRQKYADVSVPSWRAFVFTHQGRPSGQVARTMRELAICVRDVAPEVLDGHLERGDISRWVLEVFMDRALGHEIQLLEQARPYEALSDIRAAVARQIERRYVAALET